jgi:hypothetical protein
MGAYRKVLVPLLGVASSALFAFTVNGQAPAGLMGIWKLDPAKSTFTPGPAPKSMTITYTPEGESLKIVVDVVPPTGKPQRWETTAAYDGKGHPLKGNPDADTIVLERIDATKGGSTFTKAGKITSVHTRTLSADGKTLTIVIKGTTADGKERNDVAVFEKQP